MSGECSTYDRQRNCMQYVGQKIGCESVSRFIRSGLGLYKDLMYTRR
jgi:hypothetical protein